MTKVNGLVIPAATAVSLVVAVIIGAVAYGQQEERVNTHDRRIQELEKTPLKVQEIDKSQAVMRRDIEMLVREQRTFREETGRTLDRILGKLDNGR